MGRQGRTPGLLGLVAALALLAGCASPRVTVRVPPRLDLGQHGVVGLVEVRSAATAPLPGATTDQLLHAIQSAQPGVAVLELGPEDALLRAVGRDRMDREAIRALGEQLGVDVLLVGQLDVAEIRPKLRLGESLTSIHARAEMRATLSARLLHTASGVTLWTNRSAARADVARVSVSSLSRPDIRASDPEAARETLVHELVHEVTADFRPTWVTR